MAKTVSSPGNNAEILSLGFDMILSFQDLCDSFDCVVRQFDFQRLSYKKCLYKYRQ
jgi:hypothetical protein